LPSPLAAFARLEAAERCLEAQLQNPSPSLERPAFAALFRQATAALALDEGELAALFRVSRPTIGRWKRAESAPHPLGQGSVWTTLHRLARAGQTRHRMDRR
jgi:hypothetical protein